MSDDSHFPKPNPPRYRRSPENSQRRNSDLEATSAGFDWTPDDVMRAPEQFHKPSPGPIRRTERTARDNAAQPQTNTSQQEAPSVGRAVIEGQARSVERPTNLEGPEILHFRVERYDLSGNRLRPVAVELRSYTGSLGYISEGDHVRVQGRWQDGMVRSRHVENLTTGAVVQNRRISRPMLIFLVIFGVFFIAVATFIVFGVVTVIDGPPPPPAWVCETSPDYPGC
ncbi:hypothetical protein Pd630_LPD09073 (plasmid) [Rhodococcus opacus PD630]|uniref:hypothetical protein n=1 Tax=Rhodococcus opacus TaxID=37919 RepID=UPI00042F59A4|nr:hypothetical protein [Rhodococcus opacus]AHK35313.1 hypothetical protein Pd630_LPD09073 [Rhodococcus opacus PD630]UDH01623.1 hypothetical protein K2Z90_008198 [Rhodococcus opacus PD630]